jgi:hypothetical protein
MAARGERLERTFYVQQFRFLAAKRIHQRLLQNPGRHQLQHRLITFNNWLCSVSRLLTVISLFSLLDDDFRHIHGRGSGDDGSQKQGNSRTTHAMIPKIIRNIFKQFYKIGRRKDPIPISDRLIPQG